MTMEEFRILHSRLIMNMQRIESELRHIYAALKPGNFAENLEELERANLGQITKELKRVDESDGIPDLTPMDYDLIDGIRETRNYWCHQCYLDFVYMQDQKEKEEMFQCIAARLRDDEERTYHLRKKLERIRQVKMRQFSRK